MRFLVVIVLIAGCAGAVPSQSAAPAAATIATPSATAEVTASPTANNEAAIRHIVDSLDELAGLVASGGDIVGWANQESDWFRKNDPLPPDLSLSYREALIELLTAVVNSTDRTPAVETLAAMRAQIAALVGGVPTPEPTEASGPTQYRPGDVISITTNGEPWAEITVTNVKQATRYGSGYYVDRPAKGNVYISALITYTALDDGVDYNPYDWQIFVAGVAVDDSTFVSDGPKPELRSGTLPKGRKASGYVLYEIPAKGEVLLSYGGRLDTPPVFEVVLRAS
jgi:hypothetical protein